VAATKNYIDDHLEEIRGEFKLLEHWAYLNAGDQMIPANYWLKAAREFYDFVEFGRMEDIPVADIATHPFLTAACKDCIDLGAAFINADPDEVTNTYRPAVTANLVFYNMFDWTPRDNIVFTDLNYPSIPYILVDIGKRFGVEIRVVKNVAGEILLSDMERVIDENTKLVCVDRTAAFCGFTYDMKELCRIAHAKGALVFDDAIQALGAIKIDVKDDDVDMLVSGAYKWQCGPEGAGLLYVKKSLVEKIDARYRNYLWADIPAGIPFALRDHDNVRHWDYPPIQTASKFSQDVTIGPALFGWKETLKFYKKIGIENVEERIKRLGGYLIDRLEEIGCIVKTPKDVRKRHGMVVYTTGSYDLDVKSFQRFAAPGRCMKPIKVSMRSLGGIGNIRVCAHFFTSEEEIDYLIKVQKAVMDGK